VLAAGADCPVAAVFFHQVFDMGYSAHVSRLTQKCENRKENSLYTWSLMSIKTRDNIYKSGF
jgi:hypothetical protein